MGKSVYRVPFDAWIDPTLLFLSLAASDENVFWLDSGDGARTGFSYLGVAGREATRIQSDGILDVLRDALNAPARNSASVTDDSEPTFQLGWVGWLGYEGGVRALGVPATDSRYPPSAMMWVEQVVVVDHASHGLVAIGFDESSVLDWVATILRDLARPGMLSDRDETDALRVPHVAPREITWRHDDASYLQAIRECQRLIREGDAYQLCLTNEISVRGPHDPVRVYLRLRSLSPTGHGGFIRIGGCALLSASPEQFLRVTPGGTATTKPMKGTRPRGQSVVEDEALRLELRASAKEQAENVMIVDLLRNDLAKVAVPGTVETSELLAVETYPQVHQLVSTVSARLARGRTGLDAIAACFPGGSMTGTPKISAILHLAEIEGGPRGLYAGAFGYISVDGSIDLAMVIRSIVIDAAGASIGAGGGITALSIPDEELAEVKLKAAVLLEALRPPERAPA